MRFRQDHGPVAKNYENGTWPWPLENVARHHVWHLLHHTYSTTRAILREVSDTVPLKCLTKRVIHASKSSASRSATVHQKLNKRPNASAKKTSVLFQLDPELPNPLLAERCSLERSRHMLNTLFFDVVFTCNVPEANGQKGHDRIK